VSSIVPAPLQPEEGEQGLLSLGVDEIGQRTITAWTLFSDLIASVDLAGPSRSRRKSAKDLVIEVGQWPDSRTIDSMRADALGGRVVTEPLSDLSERLRRTHRDEGAAAVRAAVGRALNQTEDWFTRSAASQAHWITPSPLGPLPMATVVHAAVYQLAVVARDLAPAGAPESRELELLGLAALVDSSGAVAARVGATATISAYTPDHAIGTGTMRGSWRTAPVPTDADRSPGIEAPVGLILDLTAGRVDFLSVGRRVRLHQPRALMPMSVILDDLPELPAAPLLKRAARTARFISRS